MTDVSQSVATVMKPAGLDKSKGVITAVYGKDPTDARWKDDAGFKEYSAFIEKYMSPKDLIDANAVYGFGAAADDDQGAQAMRRRSFARERHEAGGEFEEPRIADAAAGHQDQHLARRLPARSIRRGSPRSTARAGSSSASCTRLDASPGNLGTAPGRYSAVAKRSAAGTSADGVRSEPTGEGPYRCDAARTSRYRRPAGRLSCVRLSFRSSFCSQRRRAATPQNQLARRVRLPRLRCMDKLGGGPVPRQPRSVPRRSRPSRRPSPRRTTAPCRAACPTCPSQATQSRVRRLPRRGHGGSDPGAARLWRRPGQSAIDGHHRSKHQSHLPVAWIGVWTSHSRGAKRRSDAGFAQSGPAIAAAPIRPLHRRSRISRDLSRLQSRAFSVSRLSCSFLPRPSAMAILARPFSLK